MWGEFDIISMFLTMNETRTTNTSKNTYLTDNTGARDLLLKANAAHGGNKLDKIKTMRFSAAIMGVKAISYIDIPDDRMRIELWDNNTMTSIEQLEADKGWRWFNNIKAPMPVERVAEMKSTFYSGLLGLRKPAINKMEVVNMQQLNSIYSVLCKLDGNDYIFAINHQNQLVAEANKTSGRTSVSVLSDLRTVNGIVIPFNEVVTTGIQKLGIQYDSFEINPSFNADSWDEPAGI